MADSVFVDGQTELVAQLLLANETSVAGLFATPTTLDLSSFARQLDAGAARFFYARVHDRALNAGGFVERGVSQATGNAALAVWREQWTERLVNGDERQVRWLHLLGRRTDRYIYELQVTSFGLPTRLEALSVSSQSALLIWQLSPENSRVAFDIVVIDDSTGVRRQAATAWDGARRFVIDLVLLTRLAIQQRHLQHAFLCGQHNKKLGEQIILGPDEPLATMNERRR